MKILKICAAAALLFSSANAMQMIPATEYTVRTAPPVRVLQVPSQKMLVLDGGIRAPQITIETEIYNGIPMHGVLALNYDMSVETMCQALKAAFGPVQISFKIATLASK